MENPLIYMAQIFHGSSRAFSSRFGWQKNTSCRLGEDGEVVVEVTQIDDTPGGGGSISFTYNYVHSFEPFSIVFLCLPEGIVEIGIYELQTAIAARRAVLQSSHDLVHWCLVPSGPLVLRF